jgi:C1A family cysteine protease
MKKTAMIAYSGFGWSPDRRDHVYAAPLAALVRKAPLPAKTDLRKHCPPVYDQGNIGSCAANAIAAAIQFDRRKQNVTNFTASRLLIYYNERAMEPNVGSDQVESRLSRRGVIGPVIIRQRIEALEGLLPLNCYG